VDTKTYYQPFIVYIHILFSDNFSCMCVCFYFILAPNFYMNTIDPPSTRHCSHCCFLIKQLGLDEDLRTVDVFTLIAFTCVIFIYYSQEFGVQNYAHIFIP
jgi:hypothetical protein